MYIYLNTFNEGKQPTVKDFTRYRVGGTRTMARLTLPSMRLKGLAYGTY